MNWRIPKPWLARTHGVGACSALVAGVVLGGYACLETEPPDDAGPDICVDDSDCRATFVCVGGTCGFRPGDPVVMPRGAILRLLTESVRWIDVGRGRTETRELRIANFGEENLVVDRIEVSGTSGRVTVTPNLTNFVIIVPPGGEIPLQAVFTGSDGVAFTGAIAIHSNDLYSVATPRVQVPVVVEYSGRPQLILTAAPGGQHAENLDLGTLGSAPGSALGGVMDLGPIPDGIGRTRRFFVKNLGVGGKYAVFDPPSFVGDSGISLSTLPAPDTDGRYRLGRFASFCVDPADCDDATATCDQRVCTVAGLPEDVLVLDIDIDLTAGTVATGQVRIPYATPAGGVSDVVVIDVTATGVPAEIFVDPAAVDFGDVSVGFPQSRVVRLVNATDAPMTLTRVELTGPGSQSLSPPIRATFLGGILPFDLAADEQALVRLDFVASLARLGDAVADLEIETSTRPGVPDVVSVDGRARLGPQLVTSPIAELDGGAVHIRIEAHATVLVQNVAGATADGLVILSADVTRDAGVGTLSVTPDSILTPIEPGQSAILDVTCTPTAVGELRGTVRILSTAPDNPARTLSMRCVGIDPALTMRYESRDLDASIEVSLTDDHPCRRDATAYPSPCMDLGDLFLSGVGTLDVRLVNDGVGPLAVSDIRVTPVGGNFSLVGGGPVVVPEGGQHEVQVVFQGSTAAAFSAASLRIEHDDDDTPDVDLMLVGSTTACDAGRRDCSNTAECQASSKLGACCKAPGDPGACGPACTPCPTLSHTERSCVDDACAYACVGGWHDLNGNGDGSGGPIDDGCEYACTPAGDGVESCNGVDDDCDGIVDDGLSLTDGGGVEAPQACTPGDADSLIGWLDEDDLSVIIPGSGGSGATEIDVVTFSGRLYSGSTDPTGDVDWLRLIFVEVNACAAVGFRMDLVLEAPAGVRFELCARRQDPNGTPPFSLACDVSGGLPVFDDCRDAEGGSPATIRFEWNEVCGQADDRVIDLRVQAAALSLPEEGYSCEPYVVHVIGAQLY